MGRHLGVVGAAILDRKCGGRHLGSDVVTSLTLNWGLYYSHDFKQCGILTSVDTDEPVQPPVIKLRNSK